METKQTAVECLEDKINNYDFNHGMAQIRKYIEQAKQMEKEQIKNAYVEGCGDWFLHEATDKNRAEDYYNETYGK
jgi:hypothetical protein